MTHKMADVSGWFDGWEEGLGKLAPPGYNVTRAIRNALTILQAPPAYSGAASLLECTQRSIFACIMSVVEMGLQPNGRHAHFVAYRNKKAGTAVCTLLVDWKGLVWLATQSGQLRCPPVSRLVYERELGDFRVVAGTEERIEHTIYTGSEDPFRVTHAYAMFHFKSGASVFELMSRQQIDHVRNVSPNAKRGPWLEHFEEMCRKCVLKRGCKRQQLSYEMGVALEADNAADMGWAPRRVGDAVVPAPTDEEMERTLETKPEENDNDEHRYREESRADASNGGDRDSGHDLPVQKGPCMDRAPAGTDGNVSGTNRANASDAVCDGEADG